MRFRETLQASNELRTQQVLHRCEPRDQQNELGHQGLHAVTALDHVWCSVNSLSTIVTISWTGQQHQPVPEQIT